MFIFEVLKPGDSLDYDDMEWCWKVSRLIDTLQDSFFEANMALNMFSEEYNKPPRMINHERSALEDVRRRELMDQMLNSKECEFNVIDEPIGFYERNIKLNDEVDIIMQRERWEAGIEPNVFSHGKIFMHAKSFLYALDNYYKVLKVLSKEDGVPPELTDLHKDFSNLFPDLIGVRNTSHHMEDRVRGLGAGRNPKPMDLQPVENSAYFIPGGGALIFNSLNNTKYGTTMADGVYGEIDVSIESMEHLQRIHMAMLGWFKWTGRKELLPR